MQRRCNLQNGAPAGKFEKDADKTKIEKTLRAGLCFGDQSEKRKNETKRKPLPNLLEKRLGGGREMEVIWGKQTQQKGRKSTNHNGICQLDTSPSI